MARVMNDLDKPEEALSQIEEAPKIIESLRSKVASHELRTSYRSGSVCIATSNHLDITSRKWHF